MVEAFRHVPGTAGFLGLGLQVAPGHVQPSAVTPHVGQRVGFGDVGAAPADGHHLLHLVVQLARHGRIRHVGAFGQHGVGGLGEEERQLTLRVVPHLARVGGIVAADAEDAADREQPAAGCRHNGLRGGGDHVVGHAVSPCAARP